METNTTGLTPEVIDNATVAITAPEFAVAIVMFSIMCYVLFRIVDKAKDNVDEIILQYIVIIPIVIFLDSYGLHIVLSIIIAVLMATAFMDAIDVDYRKGNK